MLFECFILLYSSNRDNVFKYFISSVGLYRYITMFLNTLYRQSAFKGT